MKRGYSGNQDRRGDSNEELSSAMGKEGTDYQTDRCCEPFQCLLDLRSTRTRGAGSVVIPARPLISDNHYRGRCDWKAYFLSANTILYKSYRLSPFNSVSQPANNGRTGRISEAVAQRTRRVVREILSDDGCTNGEDCGQGY